MEDIRGVNFNEGLARFRGKTDRYCIALQKFALSLVDDVIPFDEAVSPENIAETKNNIHTLKGVAGNLAVYEIYKISSEFEVTLKAGEPSRELYKALYETCADAKAQILAHIKTDDTQAGAKIGNTAECATLLNELRSYAETYDASACDQVIKKLRACAWEKVDPTCLNKILSLAGDYEFDDAIELIDEMIAIL